MEYAGYSKLKQQGISHVCLRVYDLERTVKFYQDVFGATVVCEWGKDENEDHAIFVDLGTGDYSTPSRPRVMMLMHRWSVRKPLPCPPAPGNILPSGPTTSRLPISVRWNAERLAFPNPAIPISPHVPVQRSACDMASCVHRAVNMWNLLNMSHSRDAHLQRKIHDGGKPNGKD